MDVTTKKMRTKHDLIRSEKAYRQARFGEAVKDKIEHHRSNQSLKCKKITDFRTDFLPRYQSDRPSRQLLSSKIDFFGKGI